MDSVTERLGDLTPAELEALAEQVALARQKCAICGGPHALRYALRATGRGREGTTHGHLAVCGACLQKHRIDARKPVRL